MISVTELRAGKHFLVNSEPYTVIVYKHTKVGRGNATIRVKIRNLLTGHVLEKAFVSGSKVEPAEIQSRPLQYLYADAESCFFMDERTFEQFSLGKEVIGDQAKFLKEGNEVKAIFWEERLVSIEFPPSLVFEVKEAEPGVRGDTVSAVFKPATLDNGLIAKVPLFIKIGDKVKVDTRTGDYLERVK